jgi:hypothetical protein
MDVQRGTMGWLCQRVLTVPVISSYFMRFPKDGFHDNPMARKKTAGIVISIGMGFLEKPASIS